MAKIILSTTTLSDNERELLKIDGADFTVAIEDFDGHSHVTFEGPKNVMIELMSQFFGFWVMDKTTTQVVYKPE